MVKEKAEANVIRNGKWKEFNKLAVLVAEGFYENGLKHGLWKYYYDSGELVIEEYFIQGRLHGTYTAFYMNGKPISRGQYVDNSREGHFYVFDEEGVLDKILVFNNDVLIEETIVSNTVKDENQAHQNN